MPDADNKGKFLKPAGNSYIKSSSVDRVYRTAAAAPDLKKFRVEVGESDLWVLADQDIQGEVLKWLKFYRRQLKEYIYHYPEFAVTLQPFVADPLAPELINWMIAASAKTGVGPMASVAGAVAGMIGRRFKERCRELLIENGGDIYLHTVSERVISIYAGNSVFSQKIGLVIPPRPSGFGVCTSAGTVGPSLSFGKADAAVILAPDIALADSAATATANRIQTTADLAEAVGFAGAISGVTGAVAIKDDKMAVWGEITLIPLEGSQELIVDSE